jgi:hypothetical protein
MHASSHNDELVSADLRAILISLQSGFPFPVLHVFSTHSILLRFLHEPQIERVISLSLAILCRHYMADRDGRDLLMAAGFQADLLRILSVGGPVDVAGSLFAGIAHEIWFNAKFKKDFIEEGFIRGILQASEQLQADCPKLEICVLAEELMRHPIEEEWVDPIGELVPMLADFARDDRLGRRAFQAFRAFARAHPRAAQCVLGSGAVASAVDLILREIAGVRLFQTALSFVAVIGGLFEIPVDLFGAVERFITLVAGNVERINWALCDVWRIVAHEVDRLKRLA